MSQNERPPRKLWHPRRAQHVEARGMIEVSSISYCQYKCRYQGVFFFENSYLFYALHYAMCTYKRSIYSGCVKCLTSVEGHKNPIDRMKAVITPEKEEEIDLTLTRGTLGRQAQ